MTPSLSSRPKDGYRSPVGDAIEGFRAFLDAFSGDERRVSAGAFHAVLEGRAEDSTALAATLGMDAAIVGRAVDRLVDRGTMLLDPATRAIVAARGLSLAPTPHALTLGGHARFVFCAIDAIGIPAALGLAARCSSACPACGAAVEVGVEDHRVSSSPAGTVIAAAECDAARPLREYT